MDKDQEAMEYVRTHPQVLVPLTTGGFRYTGPHGHGEGRDPADAILNVKRQQA